MWIPTTEDEIIRVVSSGDLRETETFDAKVEVTKKSKDLARDVAAMANDGGVIIYGIGEDANKLPTVLAPVSLVGEPERITAMVRSSIAEPPDIFITTLQTANDPSKGYIVLVVPPSPRAPHMVIVDKDYRYYGRTATGNTPLTEGEVARLYERRRRWEVDQNALLDTVIQQAPLPAHENFAYLHLVIRPVVTDDGLLGRARKGEDAPLLLNKLLGRTGRPEVFHAAQYFPDLHGAASWYRQPEGWAAFLYSDTRSGTERDPAQVLDLRINLNGEGHLFCGRAAERNENGTLILYELIIAGLTSRWLSMFGELYEHAAYLGPVDVGLAVTGLMGAVSSTVRRMIFRYTPIPFNRAAYRRIERLPAPALHKDYQAIARKLVMPLVESVNQSLYDPFQ